MNISWVTSRILSGLASLWPNPMRAHDERVGAAAGTDGYEWRYAVEQYRHRLSHGLGMDVEPLWGKDVLEVGCGTGGISAYLATVGARSVIGIDVNEHHLAIARDFAGHVGREIGRPLPVRFAVMDARSIDLPSESIDVVLADNLFEHVEDPLAVLTAIRRVLRPGGPLIIPTFSSIVSKYGLHLKHGLKVPWANLVFSETTIVAALKLQAQRRPDLLRMYPGLPEARDRVRDVRRHRDLNGLTHARFLELAQSARFRVERFRVHPTLAGRVVRRLARPPEASRALDVLSTGASALLVAV